MPEPVRAGDLRSLCLRETLFLGMLTAPQAVTFEVKAVFRPQPRAGAPGGTGDLLLYRHGILTLRSEHLVHYDLPTDHPGAPDTRDEEDLGYLDHIGPAEASPPGWWALSGRWGSLRIYEPLVGFATLDPEEPGLGQRGGSSDRREIDLRSMSRSLAAPPGGQR
ncbi:hypothetical protein [Kineococcus sp. NUM-3379]